MKQQDVNVQTRYSLSISLRLTLMFAVVAMLTFAAVGAYLYQALVQQLEARDDADLVDKVVLVRHLLADFATLPALQHASAPFQDALYGREGIVLRLGGPDGEPLLSSVAPAPGQPDLVAPHVVPASNTPTPADVRRSALDQSRTLIAMGTLHDADRTPVQIAVARPRSSHVQVVRLYLRHLLYGLVAGAALVAVLGSLIVRHGLQPLRLAISSANAISTDRLNTRLSVTSGPAELRALGAAFNAMLDRLEEGVQRLSGFAADLAHDLRTPVHTLMVETEVALAYPRSNEEYQALAASNMEEYEHLAQMIENTLFLARVANAHLAMACVVLDAQTELRRICAYFGGVAEEAGITLVMAAPAQPDDVCHARATVTLCADPLLLRRALGNLVSNAIAYTPRGGVVTLSSQAVADGTQIDVTNTGPGIAAAHLPHIFERYYRADAARASNASSGLGLAIVHAVMALHGGTVTVSSVPFALTTFTLQFGESP